MHTTADETKVRVVWPGQGGLAGNPAQICLFTGHLVSLRPRGTTGTLEIREGLRSQKGHLGVALGWIAQLLWAAGVVGACPEF